MNLEVKNLHFSYNMQEVLQNISFKAEQGTFLSVLGPNGVGKSTLFKCLLGIHAPGAGEILINSENIKNFSPKELARKIAYIPQSHNPSFHYSVFDMVLMGTTAQLGSFSSPGPEETAKVEAVLERLGISHLKNRSYTAISGGERQLTLIARALVQDARILVMDEPSASLDFGNRIRVMRTVQELAKEGYLIIQSTHDPDQAFLYSDRILALHEGQVLAFGPPAEVVTSELISKLYNVDVEVCSLRNDKIRICIPAEIFQKGRQEL